MDKPAGPTSHDVVARARRSLATRRIGHTGTLDPFASGLLLLCLGRATRLAEYLTGQPKSYRSTVRLGQETDSDDLTGEPTGGRADVSGITEAAVLNALAPLRGPILQLPPCFSAKKVAGERAYDLARRGEDPGLQPVPVTVYRLELVAFSPPDVVLEMEVSSGTYVRSIGRDLGRALGVGAHLRELRRTAIGARGVEGAVPLAALEDGEAVRTALLTPLEAIGAFPRVEAQAADRLRVAQGQPIAAPAGLPAGEMVAVHQQSELLAIAQEDGGVLRPRKVFVA